MAEALNKLTNDSAKMQNQQLATIAVSAIDWFDGTDKSNTMSWLQQMEVVAERNNQAPLEVDMAKLKGTPLCHVHKIHDLTWPQLQILLVENYSDMLYISDAMVAYNRISQAEDESVSQYLILAKNYLQQINHTSRLASKDDSGLNHISLVQGFSDNYVRRRASKDAENWKTMANAFDSIAKIARTTGKTKAYNKPKYEKTTDIHVISNSFNNSKRGSFNRYQDTYRSNHVNSRNNSQNSPHQDAGNNLPRQQSSTRTSVIPLHRSPLYH